MRLIWAGWGTMWQWQRGPAVPCLLSGRMYKSQSRVDGRETPDFLSSCGNVQAFRAGKESREGENRRKISKHLLNICVGTGVVLVPSFLDFTEY